MQDHAPSAPLDDRAAELRRLRQKAAEIVRPPLTTTHPHGRLIARADRQLGLVRISKNASTETKVRLDCVDWIPFDAFHGPVVAFFRNPERRFLSSIPETMLRVTYPEIADPRRKDEVACAEDIYRALCDISHLPMPAFLDAYLDLVTYAFFDAHHEPQISFVCDRRYRPRLEAAAFAVEDLDAAMAEIQARFGVVPRTPDRKQNEGGRKPTSGRTPLRNLARRLTRTGVHMSLRQAGPLGVRYDRLADGAMTMGDLNALANRFSGELKQTALTDSMKARISELYARDVAIWTALRGCGGASLSDLPGFES